MGTLSALLLLCAGGVGQEPEIWQGSLEDLARQHLRIYVDPLLAKLPIYVPESRLRDPGLIGAIEALTFSELQQGGGTSVLVPTEYGRRYWTFAERYLETGRKAALGAWEYSREKVDWREKWPRSYDPNKMPKLDWDWSELVDGRGYVSQTDARWYTGSFQPWLALFAQHLPPEAANAFAQGETLTLVIPDDTKGRLTVSDLRPLLHGDPDPRSPVSITLRLDPTSGMTHSSYKMWTVEGKKHSGGGSGSIYYVDWNYASSAFPKPDVENLVSKLGQRRARRIEELVETSAEKYSGRVVGLGYRSDELQSVPELAFESDGWLVARPFRAWRLPELFETLSAVSELTEMVVADTGALLDLARAWERVPVWNQSIGSTRTTGYANLKLALGRQAVLYLIDQLYEWERDRAWSDWIDIKEGTPQARAVRYLQEWSSENKRELPARIRLKRTNLFDPKSQGRQRGYLYLNTGRDPLENWPDPYDRWQLDVETRIEVIGDYVDGEKSLDWMTVYQTIGFGDAPTLIEMAKKFEKESKLRN